MQENKKLEEFNNYLKGKRVAVIGMGVSNAPLIKYLHNYGANVAVFDNKDIDKLDKKILDEIYEYNIEFHFGENYLSKLTGFDLIFRSPTCRPDLPEISAEIERGAILTSEIEMLLELCPAKTIGITGSDGKTTTSALIYEILKQKYNCYLGGNIGTPLFTQIAKMRAEDIVILELSSFQLMDMKISPNIAVVTNVSPNHLDIHKSYEEYIDAKANIFEYQNEGDVLVLNYDNDITREYGKSAPNSKVIYFSSKTKLADGIILDNGVIKSCDSNLRRHIINTKSMMLRGMHNAENACAAIAATNGLVSVQEQIQVLENFAGVKHRIEFIREIDGVKWYNDSIATSPTRTIAGLDSFEEPLVLIAGGYDKHLDYEPLAKPIIDKVSKLILLGDTAIKIESAVKRELEHVGATIGRLQIYRVNTLEDAVNKAKEVSKSGEVVILSPASASFDMFKNFEERRR